MRDERLFKALNRFAEIGGGDFTKIPEKVIRAQSKVEALEDELEREEDEKVKTLIKTRLAIALRELEAIKKG